MRVGDRIFLLAPQGRRVLAFLIDWAILIGGAAVIFVVTAATKTTDSYGTDQWPPAAKVVIAIMWTLWVLAVLCYWWLQEASPHSATWGKRAMGLRVMRTDGSRPSLGQAAGRDFARWLSYVLYGLGFWWSFWDSARQTWHDKIAHTVVIDARATSEVYAAPVSP